MSLKIPNIEYHRPTDLRSASALLQEYGEESAILAGGTDLLVDLKQGRRKAVHLISITGIPGLKEIKEVDGELIIGALTTINEVGQGELVKKHLPSLCDAALSIASPGIRNLGTIGGNIASAVPSADLPPILIAAEARVVLHGVDNESVVLLENFFTGPRESVIAPGEVLAQIIIPAQPPNSGSAYQKFCLRNANAIAVVGVAVRLVLLQGKIVDVRIVLGAVAPIPILAKEANAFLYQKSPTPLAFEEASEIASREANPISDIRGPATYRLELVKILTKRALIFALKRTKRECQKSA